MTPNQLESWISRLTLILTVGGDGMATRLRHFKRHKAMLLNIHEQKELEAVIKERFPQLP